MPLNIREEGSGIRIEFTLGDGDVALGYATNEDRDRWALCMTPIVEGRAYEVRQDVDQEDIENRIMVLIGVRDMSGVESLRRWVEKLAVKVQELSESEANRDD